MPIPERMNAAFASARTPTLDPLEAARQRLIVALDVPDAASAAAMVRRLEGQCRWFKVGLELFTAAGPAVLEPLLDRGHRVFLDLKFHDIPNTVAGAVRSAAAMGVQMLTLHAAGGPAMLVAAREAVAGLSNPPELLAVTVLTSMDAAQLDAVGVGRCAGDQVEMLCRMALGAGVRGFVCSPFEVARLRTITGPEGVLVIPGIRPAGVAVGDQSAWPRRRRRCGRGRAIWSFAGRLRRLPIRRRLRRPFCGRWRKRSICRTERRGLRWFPAFMQRTHEGCGTRRIVILKLQMPRSLACKRINLHRRRRAWLGAFVQVKSGQVRCIEQAVERGD